MHFKVKLLIWHYFKVTFKSALEHVKQRLSHESVFFKYTQVVFYVI